MQSDGDDASIILGNVFMRRYVTIFYHENYTIGNFHMKIKKIANNNLLFQNTHSFIFKKVYHYQ